MNKKPSPTSDGQGAPEGKSTDPESATDKKSEDGTFTIYYNYEEKVAKPKVAPDFTLPVRGCPVLKLAASFGYDSHRRGNLHALDANTLLFVAGSYIRIHRIDIKEDRFLRCTGGGSISCLAVAPNQTVFASGERGDKPDINIFGYPSCKLRKVLENGTQKEYVSMMFEPIGGDLLATQGGEPDYNITIWHWVKEAPLLRCKSFSQDVHKVAFSDELFGNLVTSGVGHIRFWTMAITFTGLKLKGRTGRFGTRNFTNIDAFIQFPDGKVLSGSEEGTLLLWDEELLKAEFCRQHAPNCHNGNISGMFMYEDEVLTLGEDGYIRTWSVDEIIFTEPSYHGERFSINTLVEVHVGVQSSLIHMVRANPRNPDCFNWYAQDKEGRIWSVDLSIQMSSAPRVQLQYHGGPVLACASSPSAHLVATAGQDGMVRIFDCLQKKELFFMTFTASASALIWVPLIVDKEGASVVVGFDDGVVRTIAFCGKASQDPKEKQKMSSLEGKLRQVFKPHNNRVTSFIFSHEGDIFVSGSRDKTIFLYRMKSTQFEPMCWFSVPTSVIQLVWTPVQFVSQGFLAVCDDGIVLQILPRYLICREGITTRLEIPNPELQLYKFHSIKSELRNAEKLVRLKEERARLRAEMAAQNDENPTKKEEEDSSLIEEKQWEPFYPDPASPIFQAVYSQQENYFWLTLGEYDAGYIYLCRFPDCHYNGEDVSKFLIKPEKAVEVPDCCDVPITVMKINEAPWQHLALLGFQNGHVRLVQLPLTIELDDLSAYYDFSAHDDKYGSLTGMAFAYDRCYLVTTGMDGNILMFSYTGLLEMNTKTTSAVPVTAQHHGTCSEDLPPDALWFVDHIKKQEQESKLIQAQTSKKRRRDILKKLQTELRSLVFQNNCLPPHHRLTHQEMLINTDLEKEHRDRQQARVAEIHRMHAWQLEKTRLMLEKAKNGFLQQEDLPNQFTVKAFSKTIQVTSYRVPVIWSEFEEVLNAPSPDKGESFTQKVLDDSNENDQESMSSSLDHIWQHAYSLTQRHSIGLTGTVARSLKMALERAFKSKKKRTKRKLEWEQLHEEKIKIDKDDPQDMQDIETAKNTIGNLKLKTDPSYAVVQNHSQWSTCRSLAQLDRDCRVKIIELNNKLMQLREEKMFVMRVFHALNKRLNQLSHGMKSLPNPPSLSKDEVPETKFVFDKQTVCKFGNDFQVLLGENSQSDSVSYAKSHKKGCVIPENKMTDNKQLCHRRYYKGECSDIPEIAKFVLEQNVQEADEGSLSLDMVSIGEALEYDMTSSLQQEINLISRLQIDFEERLMKSFTSCLMDEFDCKLRNLRKERFELDVSLKQADLLYISKLEEFLINKKTANEEKEITDVAAEKSQELKRNHTISLQLKKQLSKKHEECENISKKLSDLWLDFQDVCVEKSGSPMMRFLTRLYKRKLSRKRKERADESEDDLSASETVSLLSDSASGSSISLDLDDCPDTIDKVLYDTVVEMQKQRQDLDEQQNELKQDMVVLTKELEQNTKEAEILKRAHDHAGQRLLAFFEEKIRNLNEITMVVFLLESRINSRVSDGLVLNRTVLQRLHSRVWELKEDIKSQVNIMKEHSKKHVFLRRANRLLKERIDTWNKKCDAEILKKFGKPVDLKILDLVTMNPKAELLRCHLMTDKIHQASQQKELDKEIGKLRKTVKCMTAMTTNRYRVKADLVVEKMKLENRLDSQEEPLVRMDIERKRRLENEERQQLKNLVGQQAEVMHNCWTEIDNLMHHGTSNLSSISKRYNVHRIPIIRNVPELVGTRDPVHLPEGAAKVRKPVHLAKRVNWETKVVRLPRL